MAWRAELKRRYWHCILGMDVVAWYSKYTCKIYPNFKYFERFDLFYES